MEGVWKPKFSMKNNVRKSEGLELAVEASSQRPVCLLPPPPPTPAFLGQEIVSHPAGPVNWNLMLNYARRYPSRSTRENF